MANFILFKLAWREMLNRPRFSLIFAFNLSFGLIGLIAIENVKSAFNSVIQSRSRELLGSDLRIRTRHPLSRQKKDLIKRELEPFGVEQEILLTKMFSMGVSAKRSRLIFVSSSMAGFPFYGDIQLKRESRELGEDEVWVQREVLRQFGLKIGDKLSIGQANFTITDEIVDDPMRIAPMDSVAPGVQISLAGIDRAKLVQKGSTIRYEYHYKLIKPLEEVQRLQDMIDDHSVVITTPDKASDNIARSINRLTDFLGLVSLVGLFLSLSCLVYLYLGYLTDRKLDMAIYSSLGLSKRRVAQLYTIHVVTLGILGVIFAVGMSFLFLPLAELLIDRLYSFPIDLMFSSKGLLLGILNGIFGVFLLAWALVQFFLKERPVDLFREGVSESHSLRLVDCFYFIPAVLFYALMAFYIANSFKNSGIFLGTLIILACGTFAIGFFLLRKLTILSLSGTLEWRLSLRYLSRFRLSTLSIFFSLMICSLLMAIIPLLKKGSQSELQGPQGLERPQFFLFDVQDEQVEPLKQFLTKREIPLLGLSPMIRGRLVAINGEAFLAETEKAFTREEQRNRRFRNRGLNLTWRKGLSESETLYRGRPFQSPHFDMAKQSLPEISVERRYAKRMGIRLGDILRFDILGVELEGKVVNLRSVRWITFMPNFFLTFQSGVLEDAPKTWLGVTPGQAGKNHEKLLLQLGERFPNISVVDLNRLIEKIMSLVSQIVYAFQSVSLLVLLIGLLVVYSIVTHQIRLRLKDVALLKILGMGHGRLKRMLVVEFSALALSASVTGALGGIIAFVALSQALFESSEVTVATGDLITLVAGVTGLSALVAFLAVKKGLKKSSIQAINSI